MMNSVATGLTSQVQQGNQFQMNRSRNEDNFDGYLIFDFHEFEGLVSNSEQNQGDERSPTESHHRQTLTNNGMNSSSSVHKLTSEKDDVRKVSIYNNGADEQEDEKKSPATHLQGLDYLDKTKDKTNYDEFYTFLMGLDFLNISNTHNRVDPLLMDQFESLLRIKEHFVLLKNHIEKITENDSDLWFDELKNTFKLMLHQFENMINSISEQINPVSLSVCFFRCVEYIKFFDQFLHMRSFHQLNTKGTDSPHHKFRRAVRLCLLWKRLTGNKDFSIFQDHLNSDPFNCQKCEKCKRDLKNNMLLMQQQQLQQQLLIGQQSLQQQQQPQSILQQQSQMMQLSKTMKPSENDDSVNVNFKNGVYYNAKIFKDIQDGFARLIDLDANKVKTCRLSINNSNLAVAAAAAGHHRHSSNLNNNNSNINNNSDNQMSVEYHMVDRGNRFRNIISPVNNSLLSTNDFFMT